MSLSESLASKYNTDSRKDTTKSNVDPILANSQCCKPVERSKCTFMSKFVKIRVVLKKSSIQGVKAYEKEIVLNPGNENTCKKLSEVIPVNAVTCPASAACKTFSSEFNPKIKAESNKEALLNCPQQSKTSKISENDKWQFHSYCQDVTEKNTKACQTEKNVCSPAQALKWLKQSETKSSNSCVKACQTEKKIYSFETALKSSKKIRIRNKIFK